MSPKRKSTKPGRTLLFVLIGVGIFFAGCCAFWSILSSLIPEVGTEQDESPVSADLRVAYSPEKQILFKALVEDFNQQALTTDEGVPLHIEATQLDPESMVQAALAGSVQAIVPDSSLWLDVLDRNYAERVGLAGDSTPASATSQVTRWAVSPVVIAMWEDSARDLGWPEKDIGWQDILDQAQADPDFRWSHPATNSASGMLATLAQFYAGAGITRGLTEELARSPAVTEYVSAIQKTVRFYGEGEWAVIQRALAQGPAFLDAFVVQEQLVVYFNQQPNRPGDLVAIYPAEGTLWEDHPLALVESTTLTPVQRETYQAFAEYLTSPDVQQRVLQAGYRPANLSIAVDGLTSPIQLSAGVDPTQPQTTLQMPGPGVVQIVRDVWLLTKRHTNVYLVVDVSGSMEGEKMYHAQQALGSFVGQIRGGSERVGLVVFESGVREMNNLEELSKNRTALLSTIDNLEPWGDTALLDGVLHAYHQLQYRADYERINAIVVMTDGLENNSRASLEQTIYEIETGNETGVPVVIFCIAFGDDADYYALEEIAGASGGQVRTGDLETIEGLYKLLSTYF